MKLKQPVYLVVTSGGERVEAFESGPDAEFYAAQVETEAFVWTVSETHDRENMLELLR